MVDQVDGAAGRAEPDRHRQDLADVRVEAAPHRSFKLSTDPQFIDKVRDVVGLYLNPPDAAVVLCVDERTQVQALDRTAPILPMLPGVPARRSHDYVRNGTSDLPNVASGEVITKMTDQHRAVEFRKFLNLIDRSVPDDLAVHVICDNASTHKTPEIERWLARHRRFTVHYTPTYSSWLNQVERWFSELTTKKLRRSTHHSSPTPTPRHHRLGRALERQPTPLHLAQDRRQDPRQPRQLSPTNQRLTTLGRRRRGPPGRRLVYRADRRRRPSRARQRARNNTAETCGSSDFRRCRAARWPARSGASPRRNPTPGPRDRRSSDTLNSHPDRCKEWRRETPVAVRSGLRTSPRTATLALRTADRELNPHRGSPVLTCGFMPLVGVQLGVGGPTPHRTTRAEPPAALLERWFIAA